MLPPISIVVLSTVSVVLGISLLACSSLIVGKFHSVLELCKTPTYESDDKCGAWARYWVAAGSFGTIASIIQIISFGLIWLDKTQLKLWSGVHLVVFILTGTAFGMALANDGLNEGVAIDNMKTFTSIALSDMVFALVSAFVMYLLFRYQKS